MKKIVLLFLMLSLGLSVFCSPVSIQTAQRAAESFWAQMNGGKVSFVGSQTEFTEFYVFNNQIYGGFVLVSADDIAHPILGYSDKGSFRTDVQLPVNVRGWFKGISKEISSAVELGVQQSEEVREEWNSLLEETPYPKRSTRAVSALLSTTWDQGKPYNNLCPADSNTDSYYGGRTVTGCVATAMAQVMKYWNYPTQGSGSHSYSSSYGTLSANFGNTTYDWNNMPNNLTNYSSSTQKTAVATLMYHCGISVDMQYDIAENGGSGAYTVAYGSTPCAKSALVNYFKYKNTIQGLFRQNYIDTNWKNLLKADLDAGRPIMYSGASDEGGHSFVCDGYNNSDQFHFNWGWSGSYDGFFSLNAMTPGTGGIGGGGYDFSEDQDAIIGIEPAGLTVEPSTLTFQSTGGSSTVSVKAGTASTSWSATSSANWLTFSPSTGTGSEAITSVTVNATENTGSSTRTATITFTQGSSTATLTVTQTDEGTESCVIYNEDIMADDSTATTGIGSNLYFSSYFKVIAEKVNVTGNYTLDKITFADMLNTATSGSIAIKVLSATNAGAPSTTELYSATVNVSTINNALTQGQLQGGGTCYYGEYEHSLNSPINVTGPFFISVDFTNVGEGDGQTMSNIVCIADNQNNGLDNTAYINSIYSGYTGWYLISNFFSGDIDEAKFAIQAHICPSSTPSYTLTVSPSSLSYTAAGESKNVTVTSNTSWTVTSSASWLTIIPASGSNNGTITAVASANTSSSQRTATITVSASGVSSQTVSVTQAGTSGGSGAVSTFTYDFEACTAWTVDQFSPCTTYDGDGSATYTIQGSTFENQGYTGAYIAFENGIASSFAAHGGTKFGCCMAATTPPNNDWFITPAISISNGTTFSFWARSANNSYGLEQFKVGISSNNTSFNTYLAGSASTTVSAPVEWTQYTYDLSQYAGQTMYIAIMCVSNDVFAFFIDDIEVSSSSTPSYNLTVNPSSLSYTAAGESKTVTVTSNTSWTATSSANWLTVSPASGSNNGTITAVAAANTTTSQRTATITVSGTGVSAQTISVTQAGVSYNLTVNPSSLSYTADGESKTVTVTSNTSWTATSSASWLTVSPASGSNNGTITAVAAANTSTQQRTATITVSGSGITRTVSVTQAGAPTAIDEEVAEGISVYPNPTSGMFTVGLGAIEGKATCQIVNANGSIIETREINADSNSEIVFDCNVNSGVYFVRIISGNNVWTKRVVIEK
ncbi:MAG: C10 family peptidase [Bacteroidales bacterium]|nr:C10 family peptidase [Bacteroidales bacterium]